MLNKNVTAFVVVLLAIVSGCQQYGPVSPRASEIATAIYSVSNRRDAERIAAVEAAISEASAGQQITAPEQQSLRQMLTDAQEGRWQKAMTDARTMLNEQVTR